jgi:hypothetical protein
VVSKAGLSIFPKTGHAVNLEEPQAFNQLLDDFLHQVAQGSAAVGQISGAAKRTLVTVRNWAAV